MNKVSKIILLGLVAIVAIVILPSNQPQEQKNLKVELPLDGWNLVLEVINQSSAPHTQVVSVQQVLINQLKQQVDTTQNILPTDTTQTN